MLRVKKIFPWGILFFSGLAGCGWRGGTSPSILVIAVEYLGFDSFSCANEDIASIRDFSGFKSFCEESVRFTHAYTPSVMSQSTLASLMTGRYPFEHGVWHNGSQFLPATARTAAEVAVRKHYRTAFFSGGPPLWRKSGLAQGFEVFEDNVKPRLSLPYRPVEENFAEFISWLKREAGKSPFFSVIYVPDLQFPSIPTHNDMGEIREKSNTGQLRELGESLSSLIQDLKSLGRWDNTHVVLVGTNARPRVPRPGEEDGYNLYSEAVQVALYIKPARKKRDLGLEWKIDKNVTLVDLGATFFDLLDSPLPLAKEDHLPVVSLRSVLDKPQVSWNQDRILLIESGWPQWRGVGASRFSLRRGHYLVLYDEKVRVFNTLIDRQETAPLSSQDPLYRSLDKEVVRSLRNRGFLPWSQLPSSLVEKLEVGRLLWFENENENGSELTKRLVRVAQSRPWDRQLWGWKAIRALKEKNWRWLEILGQRNSRELWQMVGRLNRGQSFRLSARGCNLAFLFGSKRFHSPGAQECDDELLMSLLDWIKEKDLSQKVVAREHFFRLFIQALVDRRIAEWNYFNGLKWDVNVDEPQAPFLAELLLSLPQNRKYATIVRRRLSREY